MCRYSMQTYKDHYACFGCRKSFKRRLKSDVDPHGEDQPARCPQCRSLMVDLGLDFAAPKQTDVAAWRVVERLYEAGETFHSCGCNGPGYRPREPRALHNFLVARRAEYLAQLLACRRETASSEKRAQMRAEAIAAWTERLTRIDTALARVPV
jgi:hypothetical protein